MTNGYLSKEKFKIIVESQYIDKDVATIYLINSQGTVENALHLPEDQLKKRDRVLIDISQYAANEEVRKSEDMRVWHSEKRNLGPLKEGWYKDSSLEKIMWCYKNVTITCKYFGLQTIVENLIRKQQLMIFTRSMRQMIGQMDEWDGLTIEDIRVMEEETKKRLDQLIQSKELSDE